jgi:hypothetical protein
VGAVGGRMTVLVDIEWLMSPKCLGLIDKADT